MMDRDASEKAGTQGAISGTVASLAGRPKRVMTVSEALKWAWAEELPKEQPRARPLGFSAASAWSAILRYGEVGTIVDRQPNRYGCVPFDVAGWPHEDAITIYEAVTELGQWQIDVPEDWHPMPDLAGIDPALARRAVGDALLKATVTGESGELHFRTRPDVMLIRHAIIGAVPDWRMDDRPVKRFECWPNGRQRWFLRRDTRTVIGTHADGTGRIEAVTVEVDGWSAKRQRPLAGAYRKTYLDPDPVPVMVARAEYEIFCAAMVLLHEMLDGRLSSIRLLPPVAWTAMPWCDSNGAGNEDRKGRILADLRQARDHASMPENVRKTTSAAKRKRGAKSR